MAFALSGIEIEAIMILPSGGMTPTDEADVKMVPETVRPWATVGSSKIGASAIAKQLSKRVFIHSISEKISTAY